MKMLLCIFCYFFDHCGNISIVIGIRREHHKEQETLDIDRNSTRADEIDRSQKRGLLD